MDVIYRKQGSVIVTDKILKTKRRTYQINRIERIQIKRPWFLFSLPLAVGSGSLLYVYKPYLYPIEVILCILVSTVLPIILSQIGTLCVTAKAFVNDSAITGLTPKLQAIRCALEEALLSDHEER